MRNDLQRVRWSKNMSVEQLELLSGVAHSEITKIENNQVSPSLLTMCKLSKALRVKVWEIWDCN